MGIEIPEEYGGQGGSFFQSVLAIEALASVDPSAAVIVDVQNTIANNVILRWGTAQQKQGFLPRLATDTIASFALSEAGAGSDAFALTTRAVRGGDGYVITGRKMWITNAAEAGLYLVFANGNPDVGYRGITCFVVERSAEGLHVGKKEDKLGIRASDTCPISLDDCAVPEANLLGQPGEGLRIALSNLEGGRIGIAAQAVGIARAAFDAARLYASERIQFGKALKEHQTIANMLADMATRLNAARLLVHHAARLRTEGKPCLSEASQAKLFASELAEEICSNAIQIHGGYGYLEDYAVERHYRDARITQIYEGTSEVQRMVIARHV